MSWTTGSDVVTKSVTTYDANVAVLLNSPPATALDLPALGRTLFKNTNLIFGTSVETFDAFTSAAQGTVTPPKLPQVHAVLLNSPPAIGIELPILGPRLFKNTNLIVGTSAQTLGGLTNTAQGSVTAPQLPQVQALLLNVYPVGLALPILGPPLFTGRITNPTGAVAETLDAFTSSASGSTTAPQLPQYDTLFAVQRLGIQLPILGPPLFAARVAVPTVTGTVAATLDAFTSSASGGTGPSGTVADTLDPLTSAASGSTTRPTQPWLQAVLLRPPPAGPPLPLSPPRPTLEFGAAAAILGAFTSNASGGTGPSGSVADTLDLFTASASGGFGPVGTVAVTLANAIADASGSSVIGTVVAVLQAFICIATGTATPDDPNPLTLTYRDRGHTGTIEDTGHTLTIHDRGHTATAREQR